jgi:hypothetical protein
VVRQLEPLRSYAPTTDIPIVPIIGLLPAVVIAVLMHSAWLTLGTNTSTVQVKIAGDALYGSGLVVLGLWLSVGLWIGAIMVSRSLMIAIASALSAVVSIVVVMYALFVWSGGRLLDWLVPSRLGDWTAVTAEPQLYIVLVSSAVALGASVIGLFPKMQLIRLSIGSMVRGRSGVYYSDVAGAAILLMIIGSVIWQLL